MLVSRVKPHSIDPAKVIDWARAVTVDGPGMHGSEVALLSLDMTSRKFDHHA